MDLAEREKKIGILIEIDPFNFYIRLNFKYTIS